MKILFLCSHNRCRSILSEVITSDILGEEATVASAGTKAEGQVHPLTLKHLEAHGYRTTGLTSKSVDDVRDFAPDLVMTVCDDAAADPCPVWPEKTLTVHWPLPDPTRLDGVDARRTFDQVIRTIEQRALALKSLTAGQRSDRDILNRIKEDRNS